ncbi:LutB/LldF family L-lactate oxidation iron-sulfur protein [Streptomyces doebereineriae]|uniref:LutB/LldF family L-lactate oxidation iron-sulfur protein n=1 Tax=Streptomyces doebereineriae TaxID=3075528 RepID=A0ABU2V1X1_9ACTN|nr:LutB/LldF family L-lactate oxidation iron-sulfur protein [Streptomyces sp. DSM 41640]MDT0479556.1 LutB/LldF family L-lactate oxidation iron-sulfur protein [Streptomyces sp. DSM 41640]
MSGADNVIWLGTPPFPEAARAALADTRLRANLRRATGTIRDRRLAVTAELDDWEDLRDRASAVKRRTLRHLDRHLLRLEETVIAAGGTVHWAADAAEANRIVTRLVLATGASEIVKVKSMATQEIGLNEALAEAGVRAYETDLAELIVQLGGDRPSHILVPAIHRGRSEIREIFRQQMGKWGRPAPEGLTDDPRDLAEAARLHLREKFLRAKVAVSGANFAAADTGTVVVVESEGNGRMCLTLPETLITVMGIEKVLPSFSDLDVFLQLLPRSSTGERMNPYTSLWTGVTEGDGPQDFHLVLLDNGRTATLADEVGRQALSCIRCSACLNVCPVYERTGGHAYGSVYPGPIGAVLTPQLVGVENAAPLPFASTLCGACYDACPVKIDIPEVLFHLRAKAVEAKRRDRLLPTPEALAMKAAGAVLSSPRRLAAVQRLAALGARLVSRDGRIGVLPGPFARWSGTRDTPSPARESLRAWWRRTREAGRTTTEGKDR